MGISIGLLAGVGYVAVFSGASNAPLASTVMAIEIFGTGIVVPALICCLAAYAFSNHRGIYTPQHIIDSEQHQKSDIIPKFFRNRKRLV